MIFSSLTYILFLFLVILLYWNTAPRYRVLLLLVASSIFYMSWSPPYGLIYWPVIFVDSMYFYGLSRAMIRWPNLKKPLLIFGITSELCLLGTFKYANLVASSTEAVLTFFHLPAQHVTFNLFLPLAISFTNFILISYLVDVYRGSEVPDRSFTRFMTYVAFFPHLIAGPIVRASELLRQFDSNPAFEWGRIFQGIHKFALGLFIKVFIADQLSTYVDLIYGNPALQGFDTSWVATYSFAIQIFCDFSGYTMMAQGSAMMLGYFLPENFDAPYFSVNITDFWRRWHMSLSRWLRDYLYIPLGGSRKGRFNTYRNLFITMGLGGLWHGANWTFMLWGLYQGVLLSLHKLFDYLKITRWLSKPVSMILTFHMVCLGWVLFRAQSFGNALHLFKTMFNPMTAVGALALENTDVVESGRYAMTTEIALTMVLLFLIGHGLIRITNQRITTPWIREWTAAVGYCALFYCCLTLGGNKAASFIYFQF